MNSADRLIVAREALGFSLEKFSTILDYELRSYRNIESGYDKITKNFLKKLKRKTNINPDWVVTGEGQMLLEGQAPPYEIDSKPQQPAAQSKDMEFVINLIKSQSLDIARLEIKQQELIEELEKCKGLLSEFQKQAGGVGRGAI